MYSTGYPFLRNYNILWPQNIFACILALVERYEANAEETSSTENGLTKMAAFYVDADWKGICQL